MVVGCDDLVVLFELPTNLESMTAELIIGIGQETLDALVKLAANTLVSPRHTPLERFAALILKGIAEDLGYVRVPVRVLEGFQHNAERIRGDADAGKQTGSLSPSDDAASGSGPSPDGNTVWRPV